MCKGFSCRFGCISKAIGQMTSDLYFKVALATSDADAGRQKMEQSYTQVCFSAGRVCLFMVKLCLQIYYASFQNSSIGSCQRLPLYSSFSIHYPQTPP